jgi:hypothetical protein
MSLKEHKALTQRLRTEVAALSGQALAPTKQPSDDVSR